MITIKESKTYQALASSGLSKFHKVSIQTEGSDHFLLKEWWSVKQDGEESLHQFSVPKKIKSKNIGKANETSLYDQSIAEYESTLSKYLDKGYHLEGESALIEILPMLAKTLDLAKFNGFPCYLQGKLDGTRMLMTKDKIYSRKGKSYIPEVVSHLVFDLPDGTYIDGELILPSLYSFQDTMKAIKKFDTVMSPLLEFIVYDCYFISNPTMNFIDRYETLKNILKGSNVPTNIKLLPILKVNSLDELQDAHSNYTTDSNTIVYEGTMVRLNAPYTHGQRSSALLKHKDFLDSEYKIIDVVEGEGLYEGCGIFVCVTEDGQRFNVTPKTSISDKKEIYSNKTDYIGRQLKVKYQCLSDTGIPRFPVGLVREEIEG